MPTKVKKEKEKEVSPLEKFREHFKEVKAPAGGLPTMPTRISDISLDELGNMISRYSAWREYAEDRHLEATAVYAEAKSNYDNACDKMLLTSKGETVTERKASAKVSPQVSTLAQSVLEAETYKDLLGGKLESFTNVLSMLSRELTRRGVYNQ